MTGNRHGHPSKKRSETWKKFWADPEWRAKQIETRKKVGKAWSAERRKKQSEWAKTLNLTMPKEMRKANGKKISAKKQEYYRTNAKARIEQSQDPKRHIAANKRTRDLQKARKVLEPWGLYVEDNTSQEELDEIIAIFM